MKIKDYQTDKLLISNNAELTMHISNLEKTQLKLMPLTVAMTLRNSVATASVYYLLTASDFSTQIHLILQKFKAISSLRLSILTGDSLILTVNDVQARSTTINFVITVSRSITNQKKGMIVMGSNGSNVTAVRSGKFYLF